MIRVRIELSSLDEEKRLTGTADGVRATVATGGPRIAFEGEALSATLSLGSLGAAIARGDELVLAVDSEHAALALERAGDLRFALGDVEDLGRMLGVDLPVTGGYTRVDLKQGTAIARREVIASRDALAFWLGHFVGGRR